MIEIVSRYVCLWVKEGESVGFREEGKSACVSERERERERERESVYVYVCVYVFICVYMHVCIHI